MPESIAILYRDVAIMLFYSKRLPDPTIYDRKERAILAIRDQSSKGAKCLITTPTIVELASWRGGPEQALAKLRPFLSGLRVCGLTIGSAQRAGEILIDKLKPRPAGKSRHEIKFDALIAGIAHDVGAQWLITGNAKDYRPLLTQIGSFVQLIDIDSAPTTRRQLSLADQSVRKAPAGSG